ncbi:lipoprotein [Streptomyces violascens]|uniref:Lipoprotein n=1 Tax=Streptomyces violascens TaxID=67381 RepID=A0ABQ3R0J0_9ACTN|nr:lipoprotein [Streptomyces violascens]GHI42949.1 lipoprotein [Streptomyces violascens]
MIRHLRTALLAPLLTAVGALLLSGCGGAGHLESSGATPTAIGPIHLWPDLPPATATPNDYGETDTEQVPGIKVSGGDVRKLSPVAVVQAEVKAHPNTYSGEDGLYDETVRQLAACKQKPGSCPVLKPYYRDLTGDGKDELIVGIRMPDQQLAVRCYMPAKDGGLIRIMSTVDQIISVDLAGRDVILRSVSAGMPGYEYRTAWSWDDHQQAMLPTRDEIVRRKTGGETPGGKHPAPSGAGQLSPSPKKKPPTAKPSATPTADAP